LASTRLASLKSSQCQAGFSIGDRFAFLMVFSVSEINPYPVEALKDFHNYLDVETNLL